jgi:hypothetical protein
MSETLVIDFPLRGEWVFLRPPGHHPYAFDFVGIQGNRKRRSPKSFVRSVLWSTRATDFFGWSRPIFAPVDGLVVQASDGWPDNKNVNIFNTIFIWFRATFLFRPKVDDPMIDIRPNVGNHVMIKSESGVVVFMAHMRSGSVKVDVGQRVSAGETLGEVGNSGNTTAPHLHLNVFDQADDLLKSRVLPFVLKHYERWNGNSWEPVQNSVPSKGEVIRVQALT